MIAPSWYGRLVLHVLSGHKVSLAHLHRCAMDCVTAGERASRVGEVAVGKPVYRLVESSGKTPGFPFLGNRRCVNIPAYFPGPAARGLTSLNFVSAGWASGPLDWCQACA